MGAFKVRGADEITRHLRSLAQGVQRQVIEPAVKEALKPIAAELAALAPKRSGDLARTVKVRLGRVRKRGIVSGRVTIGLGDFKPGRSYAGAVNFGSHDQQGQHFAERSLAATAAAAKDAAMRMIRDGIVAKAKG